jgi:hypothetical protein
VTSFRPFGSGIGSSNGAEQGTADRRLGERQAVYSSQNPGLGRLGDILKLSNHVQGDYQRFDVTADLPNWSRPMVTHLGGIFCGFPLPQSN